MSHPALTQRPSSFNETLRASALPIFLYILAATLIGRAIITQNYPYPDLKLYSDGISPMPFRARYFMTPILRWAETSAILIRASQVLRESARGPQDLLMQITQVLSLLSLGPLVVRLRNAFSPARVFPWLAPWIFLWVIACTFVIRYESRFYLPYDLLSIFFFTVGVIACVEFRPLLLLLVFAVGTYNRETTIFLLPIWVICNFNRSRIKLFSTATFALIIFALIKLQILRWIGHPDSGLYIVMSVNGRILLFPHHWPQLVSVGGFLVLPLWLGRRLLRDPLLKRVWLGYLPWLLVVLLFGWWNETRIFGEITALIAVTAAIEFETCLRNSNLTPAPSQHHPSVTQEMAG